MNQEKKVRSFIIVLSIAAGLIGIFRIISLTNVIGDYGNGYFAASYELYSIFILLASYCFSVSVTKMVSARIERGQIRNAFKVFRCSVVNSIVIGSILSLLFYFGADFFAADVMKIPGCAFAIRMLAPAIVIICISGSMKGFLNGMNICASGAVIEIVEEIIIWVLGYFGARHFFQYGDKVGNLVLNDKMKYIYGAMGSVLGISIGALIGLFCYIGIYILNREKFRKMLRKDGTIRDENDAQIYHVLLKTIMPLIGVCVLFNIHIFLSQSIFHQYFKDHANMNYSIKYFGIFYVKFRSVLLIPILFFSKASDYFSTECREATGLELKAMKDFLKRTIRKNLLFSIPITIFMAVMCKSVTQMLFGSGNEVSQYVLLPGTSLILIYSIVIPTSKIMKLIKKTKFLLLNLLIANIVYFISLIFMMRTMSLGIEALMYSAIIFALCILIGNYLIIGRALNYRQEKLYSIFIPYNAAFLTGVILAGISFLLVDHLPAFLLLIITAVLGFCIYWLMIAVIKGIHKNELEDLPGGQFIIWYLDKIHMLKE